MYSYAKTEYQGSKFGESSVCFSERRDTVIQNDEKKSVLDRRNERVR